MTLSRVFALVLTATILLLASIPVLAVAPASGVRGRLAHTLVLRGNFEQEKRLQGFRNPLRSSGDFLIARERGVVWNTRKPFASSIVMSQQRLLAVNADGSARALGKGGSHIVSTANTLMMALLTGDIVALTGQFNVKETLLADGAWRLDLVPKSGAMKKVFRRIELQGDRHVRSVHIDEVSGDRTEIRFLDLRDAPAELNANEASRFG